MRDSLFPLFAFIHDLDEPFAFIFLIGTLALALGWYRRSYALGFFVSIGATFVVTNILKHIFAVPRPDTMLLVADGFRFPSMHAAITGAITGSLWAYAMRGITDPLYRAVATLLLITILATVAISRVVLNVHEPVDVLVGSVLGVAIAYFVNAYVITRSE